MRCRSFGCPILHVDMDAFFASVAIRDRPELADVPVIVGGGHRSVVLAANYPARQYGVRSALPMTRARRMCPDAVVLAPDYSEFETVSSSVMEIFREITPIVETVSLDEAFLDVSGSTRRFGSPLQIAELIRAQVADEQRITCSVGLAGSVSVAKLASRRAKPDGVVVVPPSEVTAFLHPLDVGELYGVGEKTRDQLHRLGLMTVGDVAHTPIETLQRALGPAAGSGVHHLAWGTDRTHLKVRRGAHEPDKSIGAEATFGRDTDDPAVVLRELLRLSGKVGARIRAAKMAGRTVTVKLRFADFSTITRSRSLPEATDVTGEIYAQVSRIYTGLGLQRARIRLVGVRVEGLLPKDRVHRQLALDERDRGWEQLDQAMDAVALKYGRRMVDPAALLA